MRSHSRASNDSSSLYPVQPLTRANTTQESDQVITPRDAFGYSGGSPPKRNVEAYRQDLKQVDETYDVEPYGPYFSLPRDPTAGRTPSRRGTTKELIGRYESMSPSHSSRRRPSITSNVTRAHLGSPARKKTAKGPSPIRQSFRNLLSVFSRKPKTSSRDHRSMSISDSITASGTDSSPSKLPADLAPLEIPRDNMSATKINRKETIICNTPNSLHSGTLLYLCRPSTPTSFPVWTSCTAVLHPSHILVTWHSSHGNPATLMVTLAQCTDVRSLSLKDLEDVERRLLPSSTDDIEPKAFELLFEGRAREKFAANSVKERATWVSAIWDAILQGQDRKSYLSIPSNRSPTLSTSEGIQSMSASGTPVAEAAPAKMRLTVSVSSNKTERTLPPLPALISPLRVSLYDAPVSRNSSQLTANRSSLQTPPSRSQSPSIRNLDQRSVVRQRLAQLERTNSEESSRDSLLVPKSTRSRQYTPSLLTPTSSRRANSAQPREGSTISSAGESIIESYTDTSRTASPLSDNAASAASSRTLGQQDVPGKKPPPSREDVFSPASDYSTDGKHQAFAVPFKLHPIAGLPVQESRPPLMHNMGGTVSTLPLAVEKPLPKPDLEDRLANLQSDITALVANRDSKVPSVVRTDEETQQVLRNVDETVKRVEDQGAVQGQNMTVLRAQVNTVLSELRAHATAAPGDQPTVVPSDIQQISQKLEDMRSALSSQLPVLMKKIESLGDAELLSEKKASILMQNLPPSKASDGVSDAGYGPDFSPLEERLDLLLSLYQTLQGDKPQGEQMSGGEITQTMQEILELVQNEQIQRTIQAEQQLDSVRYLNELNSWLEAFVKHGTSQIDSVAAGVQQLCSELGPVTELQDPAPPGTDSEMQERSGNLLSDIRSFMIKNQEREESTAMLQASVNGLVAAVQEDLRRNAEARSQITTESIVGLIERQRQDQERMLRALASDLSNDIRGERLRFVEAMKEATAINVQIHVEEFKKELTREVLLMTQEVGRLQRERKSLEQQIADLFGFYAKQKQATETSKTASVPGLTRSIPRRTLTSVRRRPLPTPSPGPLVRGY